jgi:RND family efflux transporter MFP subunit
MPSEQAHDLHPTPPRHLKTIGVAVLCVAGAAVAVGLMSRVHADQRVTSWTAAQAVPVVKVISLNGVGAGDLILPGDIQAFHSAPIHARVSGYLKSWTADIGAPVRAGQVIAEIDTPDLDQQLAQAKADLATAVANQHLSKITATRWDQLRAKDAVSQQDDDTRNGDLEAKTALMASAKANLDRLEALEAFKKIIAPFDGVVTTRSTDLGALITVGGPTDVPLFTIADERRLRIYVQIPQVYIAAIKTGMQATFTVPEYPGRTFTATLDTTARAVQPQSGSQLVELQIDNLDGALKPGAYAQVKFDLPADANAIRVPSSALIFKDQGMSVAVLGPNGRATIRPVTIGRDFGATVEIQSGLTHADRVIDNPPDSLRPGDLVRIASAAPAGGGAHGQR